MNVGKNLAKCPLAKTKFRNKNLQTSLLHWRSGIVQWTDLLGQVLRCTSSKTQDIAKRGLNAYCQRRRHRTQDSATPRVLSETDWPCLPPKTNRPLAPHQSPFSLFAWKTMSLTVHHRCKTRADRCETWCRTASATWVSRGWSVSVSCAAPTGWHSQRREPCLSSLTLLKLQCLVSTGMSWESGNLRLDQTFCSVILED